MRSFSQALSPPGRASRQLGFSATSMSVRWTAEKANAWAGGQPWTLGCNYIPRTAINTLEMWQAETFDPLIIDQELGWAEDARLQLGPGLPPLPPLAAGRGRLPAPARAVPRDRRPPSHRDDVRPLRRLLEPQVRPQGRSRRRARASTTRAGSNVRAPGLLESPGRWGILEAYTKGVVGFFREDRRVLAWDLYNEPGNSGYGSRSLPLVRSVFAWARAAGPAQPLTVGIWDESKDLSELNRFQAEQSDIISFHSYQTRADAEKRIAAMKASGRPVVCTEYMARTAGSRFEEILPLFKAHDVGAMNWGFVRGRTQTVFPWGSKEGGPEPEVWFHDVLRPDGAPYLPDEAELIRRMAGKMGSTPAAKPQPVREPFHAWALTPPLGWNSWDSFGQAVTEADVKANADFMAARLAKLGWRYVVVDIEWSEPQRLGPDYPVRSKSEIDAYGRFVPSVEKFPSAAGGRGFKPLADYVHRKGLAFGVHIVRGIPRLAVERNTPVEGTSYRAADIADKADYCDWNEDQWGVDVRKPGAQEWYDSLVRQLAAWGVDLVKADDLCYRGEEIAMLRRAIDRTDRPDRPEPVLRSDAARQGRRARREREHVAPARRPLGLLGPGPAGLPQAPRLDAIRRARPLARPRHAAARSSALSPRGLVEGRDHEPGLLRDGLARRPRGRAEFPDARRAADDHDPVDDRPVPVDVRRPPPGERRLDDVAH
ncbi:MAG: hypothetical protein M0C28_13800 [Candidatus Moduliflexus flocculans]|nr:hypothetical protein [Candidatus Moduliflexus flocculans]